MLYFDESHDLLDKCTRTRDDADQNPDVGNDPRSAYQILCRVLSTLRTQDVFTVFLSTNSSLSQYSPYHEKMWSYRSPAGDLKPDYMQAPIVELPFDIFARVKEDDVKLEQVSEPGHMVQFGRPLYVIVLSFVACLSMKLTGFGRNGRRRPFRRMTGSNVICSLLPR